MYRAISLFPHPCGASLLDEAIPVVCGVASDFAALLIHSTASDLSVEERRGDVSRRKEKDGRKEEAHLISQEVVIRFITLGGSVFIASRNQCRQHSCRKMGTLTEGGKVLEKLAVKATGRNLKNVQ